MFVKIIAPDGEYKREGLSINDHIERNRELFLNINAVKSIHVIGNRLYFDRLRLTFETENAAKDAINGWDPTGGALYYYNPAVATSSWIFDIQTVTVIGRHIFAI